MRRSLSIVLAVAALLPACSRPHANAGLQAGALRGSNLLLVTIDTLRADRVGAYGGGTLTPALDRLAADGVRFTRAHAHVPLTLPAHTSILTGLVPATHGVHNNGVAGLDTQTPTLAGTLQAAGYRTGAFVGAFVLDARFGLSRGFDVYDDKVGSDTGPITFAFAERPADRVTKLAGDWIMSLVGGSGLPLADAAVAVPNPIVESRTPNPKSRWFAWIHLFDPHAPYRAPEQRAANPYDNEVAFADAQLGLLFDRLRAAGQLDRTLIVVLADHGESLGEHGEATHGLFAYDATLRIPFIIAGPAIHGATAADPAGQSDVLPTVLELLGIAVPSRIDGHSLLSAIRGVDAAHHPIYFEALDAYLTRNWAPLTGVVDDNWKYIDLPEPELYDLDRDPGEQHNLAGREPGRMAALQRRLTGWSPASAALSRPRGVPLDPDAAARLRALGYAAVQAAPAARKKYGVGDDPKRLLDLDRRYQQALTVTGSRDYSQAAALLQSVIAERPDFTLAYTNLASVLIQSGHPRDAVQVLEEAQTRGVATPEIPARLGAAYLAAGEPARAVAVLAPLTARGEGGLDAVNTQGIAESQLGHVDRGRRLFTEVLQQSPDSATTWNNLGLLEMSAHRPREAARAFERAVAADPAFGPAWQALGAARAATDPQGAIEAWRRAEALMPVDYDLLFNLAVLLRQQGKTDEAKPYMERFVREAPPARYARDIAMFRGWLTNHGAIGTPREERPQTN